MSVWVLAESVGCLLLVLLNRRLGFLCYQICIAGVYLLALAMEQTLDYTMSVYFFFAVVPYVKFFGCPSRVSFFTFLYFLFWVILSIVLNGPFSAIAIFIIHYAGLLLFVYLYSRMPAKDLLPVGAKGEREGICSYVMAAVVVALLLETGIGLLAMTMSSDDRLMLNYQCVSGCLACVCMPLLVIVGRNGGSLPFVLLSGAYMLFWAVTSGTRGYIVLAVVSFAVVAFVCIDNRGLLLAVVLACVALLCVEIVLPEGIAGTFLVERFSESTGRRGTENQWALRLFGMQGVLKDLFGFGLGTVYGSQELAVDAMVGLGASTYNYETILSSTTLHNFWFSCILSVGVVGLCLYVLTIVFTLRVELSRGGGCSRDASLTVVCFFLAYAFVLWYRWMATGGILEMCIIAFVLGVSREEGVRELCSR